MNLLRLALRSLWNRRGTALLTIFAIAVSVTLLLGVQKLRVAAKDGFANTVSGVDLIVGARSGPLNLLLYSVFRVGDATANVSLGELSAHRASSRRRLDDSDQPRRFASRLPRAWNLPGYFEHYHFAGTRELRFRAGGVFDDLYDAVLGADVARELGYQLDQKIVIAHGIGDVSFALHEDKPFRVAGILERTGTPVDRTVHVSLEAISAIHLDWQSGAQALPGQRIGAEEARQRELQPESITAFMVGMQAKVMTFTMQRAINEYRSEPLLAIIPGVALSQLWNLVSIADTALMIVAAFVVLAGLLGMVTAILTSLQERRREMAILRSVGAAPRHVFTLMIIEAVLLAVIGVAVGVALTFLALTIGQPILESQFGIFVTIAGLTRYDFAILASVVAAAAVMGAVPAWRAYRQTLNDGLTLRV